MEGGTQALCELPSFHPDTSRTWVGRVPWKDMLIYIVLSSPAALATFPNLGCRRRHSKSVKNPALIPAAMQGSKASFLTSKIHFCPTVLYLMPLLKVYKCLQHSQQDLLPCIRLTLRCSEALVTLHATVGKKPDIINNANPSALHWCPIHLPWKHVRIWVQDSTQQCLLKHSLIFRHTSNCRVQLDYSYT